MLKIFPYSISGSYLVLAAVIEHGVQCSPGPSLERASVPLVFITYACQGASSDQTLISIPLSIIPSVIDSASHHLPSTFPLRVPRLYPPLYQRERRKKTKIQHVIVRFDGQVLF